MNRFREKLNQFFQGRHGMDELGKMLLILCAIVYFVGMIFQNSFLLSLAMTGLICQFYRMMSRQHWDRNEENRKYLRYVKLWKMRYQERKTSRIFVCKSCGRMIRVPKGRGKIQITCTVCGHQSIHRS